MKANAVLLAGCGLLMGAVLLAILVSRSESPAGVTQVMGKQVVTGSESGLRAAAPVVSIIDDSVQSTVAHSEAPIARRVLPPSEENERIVELISSSGPATGDHLDDLSRATADRVLQELRALDARLTANVISVECARAGCVATFRIVGHGVDHTRIDTILLGNELESQVSKWPGGRINPPRMREKDQLVARVVFLRSGIPANISF